MTRHTPLFLVTVLLVSTSAVAAEPTKQECVAANSAAQDLRGAGKLRDAQVKLALCVSASCPGPVREDCGERLREVEKVMPSIVFAVKDAAGNDVSAVSVTMDAQPFAKKLDGAALVVDPGEHTFTFEAEGLPTVEKKLVVREGEKDRRERVTLGGAKNNPEGTTSEPSRVPAIIAFSTAGVGLIIGFVFTGLWASDKSAGDAACGPGVGTPNCLTQAVADSWSSNQGGDTAGLAVGFIVAGAGAITGTVLLLTSGSPVTRQAPTALHVRPTLGLGWAGIEGSF